jgi:hypothetical protein
MQREFTPNPYRIEGECAIIGLLDRRGAVAAETIIDRADLDRVLQHRWTLQRTRTHYARTRSADGRTVYLHRFLIGAQPGRMVDHHNHNGLDNRRANLRECSVGQNSFNRRGAVSGSRSGIRNVHWKEREQSWVVAVTVNGREHHFGYFKDVHAAEQAAIAARARIARRVA